MRRFACSRWADPGVHDGPISARWPVARRTTRVAHRRALREALDRPIRVVPRPSAPAAGGPARRRRDRRGSRLPGRRGRRRNDLGGSLHRSLVGSPSLRVRHPALLRVLPQVLLDHLEDRVHSEGVLGFLAARARRGPAGAVAGWAEGGSSATTLLGGATSVRGSSIAGFGAAAGGCGGAPWADALAVMILLSPPRERIPIQPRGETSGDELPVTNSTRPLPGRATCIPRPAIRSSTSA